jgi:hypothetical protein
VTGYVLASLIFLGGVVAAVIGKLIDEEIRGWLDYLPHAILRLAAGRLDAADKTTIYEAEWLPELTYILRGAEARPITRLIIGIKFSAGLLITANRVARHLHRASASTTQPQPAQADITFPASRQHVISRRHIIRIQVLEARLRVVTEFRAGLAGVMNSTKRELDTAIARESDLDSSEEARMRHRRTADGLRAELDELLRRDASMTVEEHNLSHYINLVRAGGQQPAR